MTEHFKNIGYWLLGVSEKKSQKIYYLNKGRYFIPTLVDKSSYRPCSECFNRLFVTIHLEIRARKAMGLELIAVESSWLSRSKTSVNSIHCISLCEFVVEGSCWCWSFCLEGWMPPFNSLLLFLNCWLHSHDMFILVRTKSTCASRPQIRIWSIQPWVCQRCLWAGGGRRGVEYKVCLKTTPI